MAIVALTITLLFCLAFLFSVVKASAFTVQTPAQIEDYIIYQAQNNGVRVQTALYIARCESGFKSTAKNPESTASGVFQFLRSTWNFYAPIGWSVWNPIHNVNVAIDIMANEGFSQWKCFTDLHKGIALK